MQQLFALITLTHLLRKKKYLCIADLIIDWFGFWSFAYNEMHNRFTRLVKSKPVELEVICTVMLHLTK